MKSNDTVRAETEKQETEWNDEDDGVGEAITIDSHHTTSEMILLNQGTTAPSGYSPKLRNSCLISSQRDSIIGPQSIRRGTWDNSVSLIMSGL